MAQPTVNLFISAVTDEFGRYREALRDFVGRPGVRVEEQSGFIRNGLPILTELNGYVERCDAVVHLVGERTGNAVDDGIPGDENRRALLKCLPDLPDRLALRESELQGISYTQWEGILALYHLRPLFVATPTRDVRRDSEVHDPVIRERQSQSQREHLRRLEGLEKWPDFAFESTHHLCLQVYRVLADRLPRPDVPVSPCLPPSLGHLFKGRDRWLSRMWDEFGQSRNGDAVRLVLHGMGGEGKTQLAAEYAYSCANHHNALLMVSAESSATWQSSWSDLCRVLKLPQAASDNLDTKIQATLDWMSRRENRGWLMIIDNVDDQPMFERVVQQVRSLHHGTILLTSRIRRWPMEFIALELDSLSPEAALEYMLESTEAHRNRSDDEESSDEEATDARSIVDHLGCLALGLVQAAGTINTLRLSLRDYLRQWEEAKEDLIDDADFDPVRLGYPRSVASTWLATYRQLPPDSALVLDALCWLSPAAIPERIVADPWTESMLQRVPESIRDDVGRLDRRSLIPLYDFSLAYSPKGNQRLLSIHRLVQQVGRIWQRKRSPDPVARSLAYQMLRRDLVRDGRVQTLNILPELRSLVPPVQHVVEQPDFVETNAPLASRFGYELSTIFETQGSLSDAQTYADMSVQIARTLPRDDLPPQSTLVNGLSQLAQVLRSRGLLDDSIAAAREHLSLCEDLCRREPDNMAHQRDLGIALNNVGRVLENKGDQEGALKRFSKSQEIREDLCRREPDNMAHQRDLGIALNNVGSVLENKGDQEGALKRFSKSQ
ncbi:MAG: NB-ARC domain-containing protein, partial [Planctomycetota bacterium]